MSKSDPKLVALGTSLLEEVPSDVRAYLYVMPTTNAALTEIWRSGGQDKGTGVDGKRVMGICMKRQRSVLIHDAEKDTQMRGIKFRSFISCLCVPILDDTRFPIGLLFLASDASETFTKDHRFTVERVARDMSPFLVSMRRVTEQSREDEPVSKVEFLFSPIAIGSMLLALSLLILWAWSPEYEKPAPETTMTPLKVTDELPMETGKLFLQRLKAADYEAAWSMFGPELRARWSHQDLSMRMSNWLISEKNREILQSRTPVRVQRVGKKAQVVLLETTIGGDKGAWVWDLHREDEDWVVVWMTGPVVPPGKAPE